LFTAVCEQSTRDQQQPLFLFYHGTTPGHGEEGFSKHGDGLFPSFVIEYSPEGFIQYNHHQE
jgi:hypothetical protein